MIKNIVLDMGNVCCKWDVDYISSKLTTNKEDQEFLIKYLFQSPQWLQLDKGSISLKEAKQQLLESVSKEKRELIEYGFEHWFEYFEQFDEMEEFIKEYKQKDTISIYYPTVLYNSINIIKPNQFFNI